MKSISILIKPASSLCQMNCVYCFYKDVAHHRQQLIENIMTYDTADAIIEKACDYVQDNGFITFGFQGGEPTLAGIEFFEYFTKKVENTKKDLQKIQYLIQTNGININQQWCELFKKYHFLVGVSLDGYKENHDYFRLIGKHKATYSQIMKSINLLRKNKIDFNILTVLTNQLAKHPQKVYQFYKKEKFDYIQLIPCLDDFDKTSGYGLKAELFADFYKKLFRLWIKDYQSNNYMHITFFEDLLAVINKMPPMTCGFMKKCQPSFIIEANGLVYPCDFYAVDEYKIGNIKEENFLQLSKNKIFSHFSEILTDENHICDDCPFSHLCCGYCQRMKDIYIKDTYCAYQDILKDILPLFRGL